jgi:uncharacterized membrane protein YccC
MTSRRQLSRGETGAAILQCGVLGVACFVTYWLVVDVLSRIHSVSRDDDLLGGLWAVIATIFVCRFSQHDSVQSAISRMAATTVSFLLCFIYLVFLPFHLWAMAVLIAVSALVAILIGRPGDAITAGITSAVVMGVIAVNGRDAWQQPILRFADTVVGVVVGVAAAWIALRLIPGTSEQASPDSRPGSSA